MSGPERIWAKTHGASTDVISGKRGQIGGWNEHRRDGQDEYLRRDGEALTEVRTALAGLLAFAEQYSGGRKHERLKTAGRAALAKMGE